MGFAKGTLETSSKLTAYTIIQSQRTSIAPRKASRWQKSSERIGVSAIPPPDMVEMWFLNISLGQPLLAVLCKKHETKHAAFAFSKRYYQQVKASVIEEGSDQSWSERTRLARSCLPDGLASYHSLVVEAHGVVGMGLGDNKDCYSRAAYLAHAISARQLPPDLADLYASPRPFLEAVPDRYDLTTELRPKHNSEQFACVWHSREHYCRGYFHDEEAKVLERFRKLVQTPYTVLMLGPAGDILDRWGRCNHRHAIWKNMKAWAKEQVEWAPPECSRTPSPSPHPDPDGEPECTTPVSDAEAGHR